MSVLRRTLPHREDRAPHENPARAISLRKNKYGNFGASLLEPSIYFFGFSIFGAVEFLDDAHRELAYVTGLTSR